MLENILVLAQRVIMTIFSCYSNTYFINIYDDNIVSIQILLYIKHALKMETGISSPHPKRRQVIRPHTV